MKKFVAVIAFALFLMILVDSCNTCNKPKEGVISTRDSLSMLYPGLDSVNQQIQKDSMNAFLYFKRAQIYEGNKDYKAAVNDMFHVLMLDSLRPEFFLYAAELSKKTSEPRRGIALMDKAIASDSGNVAFYVKAAELAFIDTSLHGNYLIALNYLDEAIGKDPQNADIYFYKGNVFKEIGDTTKALSAFQTATELNPKFYNAYVQLGLLLQKRKDKNAEKYLDNAIKVSDKPEDALYAKANMLKEEGVGLADANQEAKAKEKFIKAIECFKQVVELDHRNAEACMGIGFTYYQMDSLHEAFRYYEMATRIEPTYAGAYYSQGLVMEELGRTKEAIMYYQNCLNIDANFKKAETHLKKLQEQR
ncbi:MAG: hypothetical protein JWO06_126 [Bacteroidota bacterium]|nr:hypothetical protein [Bacteroidota bacterium]